MVKRIWENNDIWTPLKTRSELLHQTWTQTFYCTSYYYYHMALSTARGIFNMINSPNLHMLSTYSSSSGSCCSAELSIYFIMLNVHMSIAVLLRMENCKNIILQTEHTHLYPNTMFKLKYILGELYFLNWLQLYIFLSYISQSGSLHNISPGL